MNIEGELFVDIVIIFVAAFLGGVVARTLRLPILLGYLAVGMAIGPHTLELVGNVDTVRTLAEFGVILLLFAVGLEVSFRDLRQLGKVVALGGITQIVGTIVIAYFIGLHLLGWTPEQAFVFGLVVSLSSTMVVLKTLTDRGELRTLHGRVITGILLVQDLAFIPMIAILPALSSQGAGLDLADLGLGILKAMVILGLMAVLGGRVIPWLLERVTYLGSREIFILAIVAITFTTAAITQMVDLSAALGAFVAGLLLSESDFGRRALSEVIPLRDTFSVLFFVSLGMLTDPTFLVENFEIVLGVVAIAIFVKFALTVGLTRGFGYLPHTALLTGLGIVQMGEFSFILTDSATTLDIVDQDFLSLIVVSAVLTMALTPWIIAGGAHTVTGLSQRVRILRPYRLGDDRAEERRPQLHDHVVVCGLGRVGSLVAETLDEHKVPFVAIDLDPHVATRFRGHGQYGIHGSSASETVLEAARIRYARLMVISTTDPVTGWVSAQNALRLNPKLDIVARVHSREEGERLQRLGVQEVVWPEMEAGLEMLRHSLQRYLARPGEVDLLVRRLREHLSFGTASEIEEVLPPAGLGRGPESVEPLSSDEADEPPPDGLGNEPESVEQPTADTSSDTSVSD